MRYISVRALGLGALACAAVGFPASSAAAAQSQARALGLPLPDVGQVVTSIGTTAGGTADAILPGTGTLVTGTTGAVGGIITGTTTTVTTTVDQTLGGILAGSGLGTVPVPGTGGGSTGAPTGGTPTGGLPTDALNTLLQTLGIPAFGGPGSGQAVAPDGSIVLDDRAPAVRFKVLSSLRGVKALGKLKLLVTTDEPGIVALTSAIRPGPAVKRTTSSKRRKATSSATKHSRKVIHIPAATLGFRKAGRLKVTVQLSRSAQRNLGNSRNARISVGLLAADAARNQVAKRLKQTVKR